MPNHIKNRLTINSDYETVQIIKERFGTQHEAEIRKAFGGDFICLTENGKVGWLNPSTGVFTTRQDEPTIGMPIGYKIEIESAYLRFPDLDKVFKEPESVKHKDPEVLSDLAHEWRRKNWGTKWNTYSNKSEYYNIFWFETAWSCIDVAILEISKNFPNVEFFYDYADEDTGVNVGKLVIKGGEIISENRPYKFTKEAYDIAFDLRPDYKEFYRLVDGEYQSIEE